jgi:hypothetical protein
MDSEQKRLFSFAHVETVYCVAPFGDASDGTGTRHRL